MGCFWFFLLAEQQDICHVGHFHLESRSIFGIFFRKDEPLPYLGQENDMVPKDRAAQRTLVTWHFWGIGTVDGRNPAPPGMYGTL